MASRKKITQKRKKFDLCPHFGPCGGCSLLDRGYDRQLAAKHEELNRILGRGFLPPLIKDSQPYHYRNKAIYPFGTRRGKVIAGFYRQGSHDLVDVHRCDIQDPSLTQMANRIRLWVEESGLPIYRETTGKGFLRALFLRVGRGTGEMMVSLITQGGVFPQAREFAAFCHKACKGLKTRNGKPVKLVAVLRNINDRKTNVLLGKKSVPLLGRDYLIEKLGRLKLRLSLPAFYQVNPEQAKKTYQLALTMAGKHASGRVIDAYAGIGTISLWFAGKAKEVIGIEEVPAAVADAKINARWNRARNCRFVQGRVEDRLPRLGGKASLVILDPPRAGCSLEVLKAATALKPSRLLYISCNPTTLARDLGRLEGLGFAPSRIQGIDFFPQTGHLEVVASLTPR